MDIADLHDRFLRYPTTSLRLLATVDENFCENPEKLIRRFTEDYGQRLRENRGDGQLHDTLRTLLCYEYQRRFASESGRGVNCSGVVQEMLLEVLRSLEESEEAEKLVLRDIALLLIGLNGLQLEDVHERWRGEGTRLVDALEVAEIVATGVNLQCFLRSDTSAEIFSSLAADVASWFQVVDETEPAEWRRFVALVLAVIPEAASQLWRVILENLDKKSLLLLCAIIEDLLRFTNFELDGRVLTLIAGGLTSTTQLHRKSAQFVLRRLLEANQKVSEDVDAEKWTKFLLVLESLEEKQVHLVLPALTHLEALKSLENFDVWLRCVLVRTLRHSNIAVVKCGLGSLLRMDACRFDYELTYLLVETLNRTFPHDQSQCSELSALLEDDRFLRSFVRTTADISWSPISLFYLFEVLSRVRAREVWGEAELDAVKLMVERYVQLQVKLLQIPTQMNIVRCITALTMLPDNLTKLADVFSSFPGDFLARGTKPWNLIVERLRGIQDVARFIPNICESLRVNTKSTILVVLLRDAGKIFTKSCAVLSCLHNSLSCLVGIDKRPYADVDEYVRSLKLVASLLNLSPTPADPHLQLIAAHVGSILGLILRTLQCRPPRNHEEAAVYVDVLGGIVAAREVLPDRSRVATYVEKLRDVLKTQFHSSPWYKLNILYLANEASGSAPLELPEVPVDDLDGRVASECYGLIAKITHQQVRFANFVDFKRLLSLAERKSDHAVPFIVAALQLMIEKEDETAVRELDVIKSIIEVCWSSTWDMKRHRHFWMSIKQLTRLIIKPTFLRLQTDELALHYVDNLVSRSENIPAARYILFTQLCTLPGSVISTFQKAILSSLLETNAGRVDRRVEMAACSYVLRHHEVDCLAEDVATGLGAYTDVVTRAQLIVLILKMNPEVYVSRLLATLVGLSNKRYFGDSNVHRVKHRVLQVLLLLEPSLPDETVERINETLGELILSESNQPSVRTMMEWILIRAHLKREGMREEIWCLFVRGREGRPGSVTSLASVVHHVARLLPTPEKVDYIKRAVTHILPSCFSQQFVVRLYSQVILSKLFDTLHEVSAGVDEYRSIEEAVRESLHHGNLATNSTKLLDNFYFSAFHPLEDYDLQVIFSELPRLSGVSSDEWIEPELFQSLTSLLPIRVKNQGQLHRVEVPQSSREPTEELPPAETVDALADIQRKIIPTNSGASTSEDPTSPVPLRQKLVENDTGLIVVASLIDGFPNLGGLARTAEIFCARELVLRSKKYTENREFQSLSVSAEKWIAISEIKPHELRNYLLDKKSSGWTLVGAEQTANSVNLLEMKFHPKTILLLGNEKNGIPANLIPLMDSCVEIPQAGVVRSLNVHVTGAICMWQYAQQHIFQNLGLKLQN